MPLSEAAREDPPPFMGRDGSAVACLLQAGVKLLKDSACTAGLAGTDVCGGGRKSKPEWDQGGLPPKKQKGNTRESGKPFPFPGREDVTSVTAK
ncbi:MAG: hypothetical protein E6J48_14800 [Chloroflexi bacterium]|nr:MAG: hypothetical protein E6J48_14800 [Chloroflexota bacterium]